MAARKPKESKKDYRQVLARCLLGTEESKESCAGYEPNEDDGECKHYAHGSAHWCRRD